MQTIITNKASFPSLVDRIEKAVDKALSLFFGDWTKYTNELEFE